MAAQPLKFQVGARTLATIHRRLIRISYTLDMVLAAAPLDLPPLEQGAHGYLVTSLPAVLAERVADRQSDRIVFVRQRYVRYHADLTIGHAAWLAQMSANARATTKRKARKLGEAGRGAVEIRHYRDAAGLAAFYDSARAVSATTYQERLLEAGLPDDDSFRHEMAGRAEADEIRAWLLLLGDRPVAYLWCSAERDALRYDHVGHDPALSALSPGAVLHAAAMRDLYEEGRFHWFDFTEGEGQHKRQFATGGTACVDLLILRPGIANRLTVAALAGFGAVTRAGRRMAMHPWLAPLAKRVRR